jgi:hypothetical protein
MGQARQCQTGGSAADASMGAVGDAYDNAMAESFFATLECELIDRRVWRTHTEARLAIFTWIEGWYNPKRRHSGLGQISPMEFEAIHAMKVKVQEPGTLIHQPSVDDGLPTGCFAPVDKSSLAAHQVPPTCPQASPVDKPSPQQALHLNCSESTHSVETSREPTSL